MLDAIGLPAASGWRHRARIEPRRFRAAWSEVACRTAVGVGLVLCATWIPYQLRLNLAAAALVQLVVVLAVALKAGFWPATIVSFVANVSLNYFFVPPIFTLSVPDPQNWVALVVFEVAALVVSQLSSKAQHQAAEAERHRRELERVNEFSRQLLLLGRQPPGFQLLAVIQRVFPVEACVLFDSTKAELEITGEADAALGADTRSAYFRDCNPPNSNSKTWIRVLRLGVRPIGALAIRGDGMTSVACDSIASFAAIALERSHSYEREMNAEAERQSEQLRTTVLDALAHEYKSPLTTIRTATTGLAEIGELSATQAELVGLIDSETKELNELTTRLLQTARLDRMDVRMRCEQFDLNGFVQALLSASEAVLCDHKLEVDASQTAVWVWADRELLGMALSQYLDNAAKYSDAGSPIRMAVCPLAATVKISVQSFGPAIRQEDRDRIFQRFYRSPGSAYRCSGTGIGLSITKKVANMHNGRVWVECEENAGNTFFLELPKFERRGS